MDTEAVAVVGSRRRRYEQAVLIRATPEDLFERLDDPSLLSEHMARPSWRMGAGRMKTEVDRDGGRRIGSRIRMSARVLGLRLWLEEVITERHPPRRKTWKTVGRPRLLVIDSYRMGFDIAPKADGSELRVFIDYDLPDRIPARWLGYLFAPFYARWCTDRIARDAARHFEPSDAPQAQRVSDH